MTRALVIVAMLASTARADDLVGLHLAVGREPVPSDRRTVFTDGLSLYVPVASRLAVGGELDLAYLFGDTQAAIDTRGFGVRGALALRARVARKSIFFVDLDGGIGAIVGHDSRLGELERPEAFAGLRLGYDLPLEHRIFEGVFDFRLVDTPDGLGWMIGVGMGWGR